MAAPPRKRCLYEILNVPTTSTPDEIRTAYRRLALQLHPDKLAAANGGVATPAHTAAFQELLHAYEVLSDPSERAYYDSHRSQILFSDPNSSSSKSRSKSASFFDVDLYSYFSNSTFSGYSDTRKGFFKVYGDLFAKLYAQELLFAKGLQLGPDAVPPAPLIGNLDSPYTQVTAFYNYWLGFSTVLDFGWVDEYEANMGMNRRARRLIEEENAKARKKARREYNDSVRGLAAFAKKRDKRVIDMVAKKKADEERKREEDKAKKKEEDRKKLERAMAYEEQEWARLDEEGMDESGEDEESKKKVKGRDEFYCVVCNKKFKSDKQWKNHEQSKKHKEKVSELKSSFKGEEGSTAFDYVEEAKVSVGFDYEPSKESEDDAVDEICERMKDDLGVEEEGVEEEGVEDVTSRGGDQTSDSVDEASILEAMLDGRKNRKSGYAGRDENGNHTSMPQDTQRKSRRAARRRNGTAPDAEGTREEPNKVGEDLGGIKDQEQSADDVSQGPPSSAEEVDVTRKNKGDQVTGKNQKNKKKQQVDGKMVVKKDANIDSKASSKGRKQKGNSKVPNTGCETCGENFDTRNKLFAHLGETGHAMLKSK